MKEMSKTNVSLTIPIRVGLTVEGNIPLIRDALLHIKYEFCSLRRIWKTAPTHSPTLTLPLSDTPSLTPLSVEEVATF